MQNQKHTPGPWRTAKQGKTYLRISGNQWNDLAKVVTKMEGDSLLTQEGLANANLIAAAPQLLEALKYAYGILGRIYDGEKLTNEEIGSALQPCDAAISTAEGK